MQDAKRFMKKRITSGNRTSPWSVNGKNNVQQKCQPKILRRLRTMLQRTVETSPPRAGQALLLSPPSGTRLRIARRGLHPHQRDHRGIQPDHRPLHRHPPTPFRSPAQMGTMTHSKDQKPRRIRRFGTLRLRFPGCLMPPNDPVPTPFHNGLAG